MKHRVAFAVACTALLLALGMPAASAHALLRSSEPANGAVLTAAPPSVLLTFTEEPQLSLSTFHVLDSSGARFETGKPSPESDAHSVRLTVKPLLKGVYTVAWRVVSRADGHATAGAFAFGVGISPGAAATSAPQPRAPPPSGLEIAARWIFFLGLVSLIGSALMGAAVFRGTPHGLARFAAAGWAVALIGLVLLTEAQRRSAGASLGDLLATPVGRALIWRAVALFVAGGALLVARSSKVRVAALWIAGAAGSGAVLAHVGAGHASASSSLTWEKIAAQWAHFTAVGVWIGGLAALLVGVRGEPSDEKARFVRRFSAVAGWALLVVAATGTFRAINQIPSWHALYSSGYGIVVLIKIGLIGVLAGLGAINRFRTVPVARTNLTGLRRVSRYELMIAAGTLAAAAVLASLGPPQSTKAAAPTGITLRGSDFGTSVRVRLAVTPGTPGPNRFSVRVNDYDSGAAVVATVSLKFAYLDDVNVGATNLKLPHSPGGGYTAQGTNLSLAGRWKITVLVEQGASSVTVPFELTLRAPPQRVTVNPGPPAIFTIELNGGGSVQIYADPERPGVNEVHLTFFDTSGNERPIESISVTSATASVALKARRFSAGHFVVDASLNAGKTTISFVAQAKDGATLQGEVGMEIKA